MGSRGPPRTSVEQMPTTERPGAPAQSAPPVGGREDGTLRVRPIATLRRPDSWSRRQPVKKATSTARPGAITAACDNRAMDRHLSTGRSCRSPSSPSSSWRAATPPHPRRPVPPRRRRRRAPVRRRAPPALPDLATVYAEINEQVRAIRGLEEKKPIEPDDRLAGGAGRGASARRSTRTTRPTQVAADERSTTASGCCRRTPSWPTSTSTCSRARSPACTTRSTSSCTSSRRRVGSARSRRSTTRTSTTTPCRTRTSTSRRSTRVSRTRRTDALARQSLVEGDAYVLMTYWLQQNLTPAEIARGARGLAPTRRHRPPSSGSRRSSQRRSCSPRCRAPSSSPGCRSPVAGRPSTPRSATRPQSTEQILHPEKYAESRSADRGRPAGRPGEQDGVGLVASSHEDTMGEHQTAIWLGSPDDRGSDRRRRRLGRRPDRAAGWTERCLGDRLAHGVGHRGRRRRVRRHRRERRSTKAGGPGSVLPGAGGTTRWVVIGSDDAALQKVADVLGLAG